MYLSLIYIENIFALFDKHLIFNLFETEMENLNLNIKIHQFLEEGYLDQYNMYLEMANVAKAKFDETKLKRGKMEALATTYKSQEDKDQQFRDQANALIKEYRDQLVSFDGMAKKLNDTQTELFEKLKPKQKGAGEIQDVKQLSDITIEKVLGKGAFGLVSAITFKGKRYALKEIDKA